MKSHSLDDAVTRDKILCGRLTLSQPRQGYRFNIDSLLLQHFVGPPPFGKITDLCAGVGVIGLALARRDPVAEVTLVELVPRIAALAMRNVEDNGLASRVKVVTADVGDKAAMSQALAGGSCDLVVASPPFFSLARGPVASDIEEATARHEISLTLDLLCGAARRLLKSRGRIAFIYPADRLPQLLTALSAEKLQPARMRLIHPRLGAPAQRVLIEAIKGGRSALAIESPFIVRDDHGYTDETRLALGEFETPTL